MMFRDFEPVAVLDWAMAALGARETDLAWMAYMYESFADLAHTAGQPGIPDFMQRDALARIYSELSGHRVRDLEFYEVFAGLRYGIVSIRTGHRGVAYGQMEEPPEPDGYTMNRGIMERMLSGAFWE